MRLSLINIAIILGIMTTGCGQVHYTVKRDQPPKMSIKEARIALAHTLLRGYQSLDTTRCYLYQDEVKCMPQSVGSRNRHISKSIYDINTEVMKSGSNFSIQLPGTESAMIVWDSEEDAKLFVDALHSLQLSKQKKELEKKAEDEAFSEKKGPTPRQTILEQSAQETVTPLLIKTQEVPKVQFAKPDQEKQQKVVIKGEKIKVGIIEFQPLNEEARKESLGIIFSEMLTTAFVNSEAFKITEREQLQKVAKELQLSQSGIIDTSQAKQLGKMVGADAIITGSVTKIGSDLRLDARIIDVQSGIILTAEKIIGKTDLYSISSMADRIVDNLVNKFYRDKRPN